VPASILLLLSTGSVALLLRVEERSW
jgi:hypothetical protein